MASLTYYTEKFGKRAGRKLYNDYHRKYRKENHERILEHKRAYRRRQLDKAAAR